VRLAEALAGTRRAAEDLRRPAPGIAHQGEVWTDIVRMRTLNADQSLGGREKHVCPLQIDIVDRVIRLYSNKGDLVFDPFAGLGTVPVGRWRSGGRGYGAGAERRSTSATASATCARPSSRSASRPCSTSWTRSSPPSGRRSLGCRG
jgi:hypothetical protein